MNDFELEIKKEEYDYLKWIEHEYANLNNEVEKMIKDADTLLSGEDLYLDNAKVNAILKRYFEGEYSSILAFQQIQLVMLYASNFEHPLLPPRIWHK